MQDFQINNIIETVGLIELFISVFFYASAAFWNIQFLHLTKWQQYSFIKVVFAVCCAAYTLVFVHLVIDAIFIKATPISYFSITFIRPLTMLTGAAIAAAARARITSIKHGGEQWILRKSQS